jgi:nitronate monooxygenase
MKDFDLPKLLRPKFYAIISSTVLAMTLIKKTSPPVDGFIVEMSTAGGHNAPPRGLLQLNGRGEPIYGARDEVNLQAIAELGVPFWLAGSAGSAEGLQYALQVGASGIQVGTAFALCDESGMSRDLKDKVISYSLAERLDVFTDPLASPTGFPFKVARIENTNSQTEIFQARVRRCNMGYLRELYKKADGTIDYRCPAEPVDQYLKKGGNENQTIGRKCLCNGLTATIGLGQIGIDGNEMPLVTIGDDAKNISRFVRRGANSFSALDVINTILSANDGLFI